MKKKVFNGLLILGVSIIWVFVGRRALNMLGSNDAEYVLPQTTIVANEIPVFDKDTFNLAVFIRDPFLGNIKSEKTVVNRHADSKPKRISKKTSSKKVDSKITWPKLKYFGYMKGGGSKEELALIRINSKLHRVREKENVDEIYVQTVYADSVVLKMGKSLKTVYK